MVERCTLPASTAHRADLAAIVLVVALGMWTGLVAGGGAGRATPIVTLLAGLSLAVVAGRRLSAWTGMVPKAVASGAAAALLLTFPGILRAGGAPTGYANSNATLAAVGVLAAAGAAASARQHATRRIWVASAAGLAGAVVLTRSTGGILSLVLAGALVVASARSGRPMLVTVGGAIATVLALGITIAMAVDGSTPLASTDIVRVELWAGATDLVRNGPLRGSGGGSFAAANPVTDDADLRWVHHEYLEIAVELGPLGLLLVTSLGVATYARLACAGRSAVPAAGALTIVALHGAIDHVWHAPAVLLLVALLVGDATGPAARSGA